MSDFYDIHSHELIIPGLARSLTLLHISDSHLCVVDDRSPEEEAAYIRTREQFWQGGKAYFAHHFGQPMDEYRRCMPTAEAFGKLLTFGRERQVDAVLSTGDLLECMHDAGARFVRRALADYPIPFVAAPGNHETAVCDGIWSEGVQVLSLPGVRIAAIDNSRGTVTDRTLAELSAILAEGVPVILMMHIPLLTDLNRHTPLVDCEPYYYIDEHTCDENAAGLFALLRASAALKLILCGHVHGYMESMPLPGVRQIIAPQGMAGGVHLLTLHG